VIERERIAYLLGVPTMIVALIDEARERTATSARSAASCRAAPWSRRSWSAAAAAAFGAPIQIVYGQTETSPGITVAWSDDSEADLSGTIGQPLTAHGRGDPQHRRPLDLPDRRAGRDLLPRLQRHGRL
jgi:fatty-acyl-CoA synthase